MGHNSIKLVKWIAYFVSSYEKISYFDLMASVLSTVIETSEQKVLHRIKR